MECLEDVTTRFASIGVDLDVDALRRIINPRVSVEKLLAQILEWNEKYPECPWGDLTKGEGLRDICDGEVFDLPVVPVVLDVGSGFYTQDVHVASLLNAENIGYLITSDKGYDGYLRMDLDNPSSINLGGIRVDAISASAVFTDDKLGFYIGSKEVISSIFSCFHRLLKPKGIFVADIPAEGLVSTIVETGLFVVVERLSEHDSYTGDYRRVFMQKVGD